MPDGVVFVYHAQERTIDVPLSETTGNRGGIHNSLTRLLVKPSHLVGGYAQHVVRVQLSRPDRQPARRGHRGPPSLAGGAVLMRVMAQLAMVMNLDKCIGCHTCSVTCKQAWTNRSGTEYVWFNNVETRPGQGYPRTYEDQERWRGRLGARQAGPAAAARRRPAARSCCAIFSNPKLPSIDDYYEPWTYDYENLTNAPLGEHMPVAPPRSLITGEPMKVSWSANWDDDLGGSPEIVPGDPILEKVSEQVKLELEQTFMFYLPRICEHCLNPSCVASCPSGAMYKRAEDGIVLVDQDQCRGWRMCVSGCPYKKVYFNHKTGKAEKCTLLLPAHRGRPADRVLGDLRGPAALHRAGPLRRRPGAGGGVGRERHRPLRGAASRSCSTRTIPR